MNKRELFKLLRARSTYLKLREYASQSRFEKAIDTIINQIDQQINRLVSQIKVKLTK